MSDNNYENNRLIIGGITSGINSNIAVATWNVPPPPVGYWIIGGTLRIAVEKKPTEKQIANTIKQFGWEWENRL